jgi:RimJ/RimL family protein N-acetyltransferase
VTDIPILQTERLLLRGFHARDFDAYAAMMADPEVTRHLADGRPLGRADAWRQLAMFAGHWTLRGFGVWAVEERATGACRGNGERGGRLPVAERRGSGGAGGAARGGRGAGARRVRVSAARRAGGPVQLPGRIGERVACCG